MAAQNILTSNVSESAESVHSFNARISTLRQLWARRVLERGWKYLKFLTESGNTYKLCFSLSDRLNKNNHAHTNQVNKEVRQQRLYTKGLTNQAEDHVHSPALITIGVNRDWRVWLLSEIDDDSRVRFSVQPTFVIYQYLSCVPS